MTIRSRIKRHMKRLVKPHCLPGTDIVQQLLAYHQFIPIFLTFSVTHLLLNIH